MLESVIDPIKRALINLPGWHTSRKIVVFESDDWGMVRMTSKESYNRLLKKGYPVDKSPYEYNDALEADDDLLGLMDILNSARDMNGNPAKFTLNMIMGNPDFDRIRSSAFTKYHFEPFTKTLKERENSANVMKLYSEGISEGFFAPQYHGREHINVNRWLHALQLSDKRFMDAFEERMITVSKYEGEGGRSGYLDTLGDSFNKEIDSVESSLVEGMELFKHIWGGPSYSFIAPCFTWHPRYEKVLSDGAVKFLQGTHVQRIPKNENDLKVKRRYHFTGQKNKLGQTYLVRNCFFEPFEDPIKFNLYKTLDQVNTSFKQRKPAIISTHRVNYIGTLNPGNRDANLKYLRQLLQELTNSYPDIEFLDSVQLGNCIVNESK